MEPMTILYILGGALLCFLLLYIIGKNTPQRQNFYSIYSPEGLPIIKDLEALVESNGELKVFGWMDMYRERYGKPGETLADYEKAMGIAGGDEAEEGSLLQIAYQYLDDMNWLLNFRYEASNRTLKAMTEEEAMEKYGLNIFSDEVIHETFKNVDWFEEKTKTTSVSYSGYRYRTGGALSYTSGSLSVIKNQSQYFDHIDRGTLHVTNKRIIFVGGEKRQNKTVKVDDILEFSVFRDGVLIGKSNGRKPLIHFAEWIRKPKTPPTKRDHLNRLTRILDRVLRQNQFSDLA